jgi:transcriptional regulator with XRE-family HTH domain
MVATQTVSTREEDMPEPVVEAWFLRTVARKGRELAGKTQVEVGDEVGRVPETISAWELGKTAIPFGSISDLGQACGLDEELIKYMKLIAKSLKKKTPVEADMRLNALFLALGEEYYGEIFKWDSGLIPGPLQTKEYHFTVARKAEPNTDQWVEAGWAFKTERRRALEFRLDQAKLQFLINEAALLYLRREPAQLRREQLAFLGSCNERSGWEIRVLTDPYLGRQGHFSLYKPGQSRDAGPPFLYTEVHDSSWCISNSARIASYDELRLKLWNKAIRFEEYRYGDN